MRALETPGRRGLLNIWDVLGLPLLVIALLITAELCASFGVIILVYEMDI